MHLWNAVPSRAGNLRGATHASDALHSAAVSRCFKGSSTLHRHTVDCLLPASVCRCPPGSICLSLICCSARWSCSHSGPPKFLRDSEMNVRRCKNLLLKQFHFIWHFHPTCFFSSSFTLWNTKICVLQVLHFNYVVLFCSTPAESIHMTNERNIVLVFVES